MSGAERRINNVGAWALGVGMPEINKNSCNRATGFSSTIRQAIQDIPWRLVIRGRVLIIGDMNADSPMWNPHCRQNVNAGPLEELIESYELIVNNDTDFPTL